MAKIKLHDTIEQIFYLMSERNPGALNVLMELYHNVKKIDPQSFLGPMGYILLLDTYEIYGSDLYVLWNDKCNRDIKRFCILIRATQLGLISQSKLKSLSLDHMNEINLTENEFNNLEKQVCNKLEKFQKY